MYKIYDMVNLLEKYGYGRLCYPLRDRSKVCRRYKDGMLFDYSFNTDNKSVTVVGERMKNRIVGKNMFHEIYDIGFIPEKSIEKDSLVEDAPYIGRRCEGIEDGMLRLFFIKGVDRVPNWHGKHDGSIYVMGEDGKESYYTTDEFENKFRIVK